jgi:hypothetical protein
MPLKMEDSADDEAEHEYAYEDLDVRGPSSGALEGGGLEIFDTRILWLDGSRLTLEFEVPAAGFMLPDDGAVVQVYFSDGTVCSASMLGEESSSRGPHHPGLTIRMALEIDKQYSWPVQEMQIVWQNPVAGTVNLHVAIG